METIRLDNISRKYHEHGNITVFKSFSFELRVDQITCLLGPSGCGKSTLARIIAGFDTKFLGTVERPVSSGRWIQFIPQDLALFPWLSVIGHLKFATRYSQFCNSPDWISELLSMTELEEVADKLPYQLSGGMKQRLALARALAIKPYYVILDESFSHLDGPLKLDLMTRFLSMKLRLGFGALIITHDPAEAAFLGERIVSLARNESTVIVKDNLQGLE